MNIEQDHKIFFYRKVKNKQRLMNSLSHALVESIIRLLRLTEMLIDSSLKLAKTGQHVVLVAQDVDFVNAKYCSGTSNILFLKNENVTNQTDGIPIRACIISQGAIQFLVCINKAKTSY